MRKITDKILEYFLSILLGLMVVNVLWQIASRYILNDPSAFTDELARYFLIWVGLIGAAYAMGKGMHVAIELLEHKLSKHLQTIQKIIILLLISGFALAVLIGGGIRLVMLSFELGQKSSAMQLPIGYVYLALPLSGIITLYYTFSDILNLIQAKDGKH